MSIDHYPGIAGTLSFPATDSRSAFICRTYLTLAMAVLAFTYIEFSLFESGLAETIAATLLSVNWLFVLGGFIILGWLASHAAHNLESSLAQYLALSVYVVAEAIIFVPLLVVANSVAPGVISSAAQVTLLGFAGLTAVAVITRHDFSFLRGILMWGFVLALIAIVAAVLLPAFELGTWFSVAMMGLAGAAILYDTSNVLRHYPDHRHIGAALELFASVALMFWYVISFLLEQDG